MLEFIRRVAARQRGEDGAASVEYGLLVAAIAAIIVLVVFAIGTWVQGAFNNTCDQLNSPADTPADCVTP